MVLPLEGGEMLRRGQEREQVGGTHLGRGRPVGVRPVAGLVRLKSSERRTLGGGCGNSDSDGAARRGSPVKKRALLARVPRFTRAIPRWRLIPVTGAP
jgi:hypothetical protein